MTDQYDSGISLKDDIASIRTDPTFHDVVLVCADGVEIGACRAILASRSAVFKAMFYGNMQESISGKVTLHDIKSAAMHAVLCFIHTEDIDSNAVSIAIEVYRAANFFLLPKLMQLVLDQVHDITDFDVAVSLLNDATSMPWNDNTELYDMFFNAIGTFALTAGDLNGLSEKALELLLKHTDMVDFNTSEYDLLLCVIEWIWARDTTTPPAAERRAIFDNINSLPTEPSIKIHLQSESSRTLLLRLLNHLDFTLICPHRFKCLIKSINVLDDELPECMWAFCYQACKNTKCDPDHSSQFRGEPRLPKFQWDQSNLASDLVFSEEGTVVEYPKGLNGPNQRVVRASTECSADCDGICEWVIVIETLGLNYTDTYTFDIGLVEESFDGPYLHRNGWCFYSKSNHCSFRCYKREAIKKYKVSLKNSDILTFHLDLNNRTCALLINGHDYGIAWHKLPHVNLYPAVSLQRGSKYRIKSCE